MTYPDMEQDAAEFSELLALLAPLTPRSILEVGVFKGGTLLRFMDAFPDATVVGIDPRPVLQYENVVLGCSQDPQVQQRARSLNDGNPFDVTFIDGDHSYDGVREDWEWAWGETQKAVVFHDIRSVQSCPDVVRFWNDLTSVLTTLGVEWKSIISADDRNGIGIVYV